jgi:hypothetical protein
VSDPVQVLAQNAVAAAKLPQLQPLDILVIVEAVSKVLTDVVKMLQSCGGTFPDALAHLRAPGAGVRIRLNLGFRQHLPSNWSPLRDRLTSAVLTTLKHASEGELSVAFDAIRAG